LILHGKCVPQGRSFLFIFSFSPNLLSLLITRDYKTKTLKAVLLLESRPFREADKKVSLSPQDLSSIDK